MFDDTTDALILGTIAAVCGIAGVLISLGACAIATRAYRAALKATDQSHMLLCDVANLSGTQRLMLADLDLLSVNQKSQFDTLGSLTALTESSFGQELVTMSARLQVLEQDIARCGEIVANSTMNLTERVRQLEISHGVAQPQWQSESWQSERVVLGPDVSGITADDYDAQIGDAA